MDEVHLVLSSLFYFPVLIVHTIFSGPLYACNITAEGRAIDGCHRGHSYDSLKDSQLSIVFRSLQYISYPKPDGWSLDPTMVLVNK